MGAQAKAKASAEVFPHDNEALECKLLTKKEAAKVISQGVKHLHSSSDPNQDPLLKQTRQMLQKKTVKPYPWQLVDGAEEIRLKSSIDRYKAIKRAIVKMGIVSENVMPEMVEFVLEELITNGIYHGYRWKGNANKRKFLRGKSSLTENQDIVVVRYHADLEGVFISVSDHGGNLSFGEFAKALYSGYCNFDETQEDEEENPIGLYVVFDLVTHLRIDVLPGAQTTISCWIANFQTVSPDDFSFNYFEKG